MDIAKGIGIPLRIDNNTLNGALRHYARVLVEVDLSLNLHDSLMIERIGKCFFIDIVYENLLRFCSSCSNIGHLPADCSLNINISRRESVKDDAAPSLLDVNIIQKPGLIGTGL